MHVSLQIKSRLESGSGYSGVLKLINVEKAMPHIPES